MSVQVLSNVNVSFDNTEKAFKYKTDAELKEANFLFASMGYQWLVNIGSRLTPWALKVGLPIKGLIKKTVFKQFVGGETLEETIPVAKKLAEFGVGCILDYGVEGGDDGENGFDHAADEFIKVINFAASQSSIPYMSIKVTGFARFGLLEKIDESMAKESGSLIVKYNNALLKLSAEEREEWTRVENRMDKVCLAASNKKIGVLVDAEETWIQDSVDALTCLAMDKYNKETCIIFNTIQLYRHDRLAFLKLMHEAANERRFILGAKIVRGAYMEKERTRAAERNYPSPIQPSKESTDNDYNAALTYCIDNIHNIDVIVASHNEYSNKLAIQLLNDKGISLDHPHISFSQLYGMSDNITFNLAAAGAKVTKYLPFGPLDDVIPYLMRRAQENSSVSGQTGRELLLIKKEIKRRGL